MPLQKLQVLGTKSG